MSSDPGTTAAAAPTPVVALENVRFGYAAGKAVLDVDRFAILPGESLFLRGPSGAGKSTLLSLLAGILKPWSGSVTLLGQPLTTMSGARRDEMRAAHLGVIFQLFNLVPYLSVLANAALPCRFSRLRRERVRATESNPEEEARRLLMRLGLDEALLRQPATHLSVGQQQRVAAARALIGGPELILADEPTSALDTDARERFITLLREECTRSGASLLFVSHDQTLAAHFDRTLDLQTLNRAAR
jgi:putative ABC transport system ATP-binding protein